MAGATTAITVPNVVAVTRAGAMDVTRAGAGLAGPGAVDVHRDGVEGPAESPPPMAITIPSWTKTTPCKSSPPSRQNRRH